MSFGILTFHRALNYGALLQAYALKEAMLSLGGEAKIVDYRNPIFENMYYYPSFFERRGVKSRLKYLIQGRSERLRRERFEAFRESFLSLSKSVYTPENISAACEEFHAFITGSDQVWSYRAHELDKNYFLAFAKDKKYSYAASFGVSELPEEYLPIYREMLGGLSSLSVREEGGISILRDIGIDGGRVDIDPTMLIPKEKWINSFGGIKKENKKYILAYYFELTESMRAHIEALSKKTGYEVLYIGNAVRSPFRCKSRAIKAAGPIEFVEAFANAQMVVTNSFHGTAFSIIFEKPMFVELLKRDEKVNGRIENILRLFSLEGRVIGDSARQGEYEQIDWHRVKATLELAREKSLEYLKGIINEG